MKEILGWKHGICLRHMIKSLLDQVVSCMILVKSFQIGRAGSFQIGRAEELIRLFTFVSSSSHWPYPALPIDYIQLFKADNWNSPALPISKVPLPVSKLQSIDLTAPPQVKIYLAKLSLAREPLCHTLVVACSFDLRWPDLKSEIWNQIGLFVFGQATIMPQVGCWLWLQSTVICRVSLRAAQNAHNLKEIQI